MKVSVMPIVVRDYGRPMKTGTMASYTVVSEPFPSEGPNFDRDRDAAAKAIGHRLDREFILKFQGDRDFDCSVTADHRPDGTTVLSVTATTDGELPE
jgi:hypothetical protein